MKLRLCSLCGTVLEHEEYAMDIRDYRDPYMKFHVEHHHICDECYQEIADKVAAVKEANSSSDTTTS